eukprot:99007-Hanusia_phi.AAC.5
MLINSDSDREVNSRNLERPITLAPRLSLDAMATGDVPLCTHSTREEKFSRLHCKDAVLFCHAARSARPRPRSSSCMKPTLPWPIAPANLFATSAAAGV